MCWPANLLAYPVTQRCPRFKTFIFLNADSWIFCEQQLTVLLYAISWLESSIKNVI